MNGLVTIPERYSVWRVFNDFDNVLDGFFPPTRSQGETGAVVPAVDVSETDDAYVVKAELPGVEKKDLDVSLHDGVLTINAEAKHENGTNASGRVIRQERRYGKYARSIRVGCEIDRKNVVAEYKDGLLTIKLPKSEAVVRKKIDVKVA